MLKKIRLLLFPLAVVYDIVTSFRNYLYDCGILTSKLYDVFTICIGNLNVGGTGKTPHCEYLIQLLKNKYNVVLLSRGYKRKTKGFLSANEKSTAEDIGDEPMQFYQKFKSDIKVFVDEKRTRGIDNIMALFPQTDMVILDDAFQHRSVTPKLNILLTDYNQIYKRDFILPMGDLRESRRGARRANIVIVTKCPDHISTEKMERITKKLNLKPYQKLFFSTIKYSSELIGITSILPIKDIKNKVVLVTGIANTLPLRKFLSDQHIDYKHIKFPDHHHFNHNDVQKIMYKSRELNNATVLTTQKDFIRLQYISINMENIFYIPITIEILNSKKAFDNIFI